MSTKTKANRNRKMESTVCAHCGNEMMVPVQSPRPVMYPVEPFVPYCDREKCQRAYDYACKHMIEASVIKANYFAKNGSEIKELMYTANAWPGELNKDAQIAFESLNEHFGFNL